MTATNPNSTECRAVGAIASDAREGGNLPGVEPSGQADLKHNSPAGTGLLLEGDESGILLLEGDQA